MSNTRSQVPAANPHDETAWQDRTLSMGEVNASASLLSIAIIAGVFAVYAGIWQSTIQILPPGVGVREGFFIGVVAFAVSLGLHELLHALGFWLSVRDTKQINFGINWTHFVPYAHCAVPMTAKAYRFAVVLPGVALGLIPAADGTAANIGAVVLYGALMLAAATGDLLILWCLRGVPSHVLVRDHPTKAGCQVMQWP